MAEPTLEQKQHIFDIVKELREYLRDLPDLMKLPQHQRELIANRMLDIKKELKKFREEYPNA